MSVSRILAIVKKEVRQLRRDRLTFGMVVGLPVVQMLLFGYAINTDVRYLRTAVSDQSGTHLSRQAVAELQQTQVVDIVGFVRSPQQLETLLRRGDISIGVVIPFDFDRRVAGFSWIDFRGPSSTILNPSSQIRNLLCR